MKFQVTYYRTLISEGEIEAESISEATEQAKINVSGMCNADFDQIHEETVEMVHDRLPAPLTFVTIA